MHRVLLASVILLGSSIALANPHPFKEQINMGPKPHLIRQGMAQEALQVAQPTIPIQVPVGSPILRLQVNWDPGPHDQVTETYSLGLMGIELSGTQALLNRSFQNDKYGSYRGKIIDRSSGVVIAYDTLGTGKEFRKLVRAMTFRFPVPTQLVSFVMEAENPKSGVMEEVFQMEIGPSKLVAVQPKQELEEVRLIKAAKSESQNAKIRFNIYAERYALADKEKFFSAAERAAQTLVDREFPMIDSFEIVAVFPNYETKVEFEPTLPVPEKDTFLGLHAPYWNKFGRWYHVVYPTREKKYRDGIGLVPYDYALVLVDDSGYWGVGNYKEITAIPAEDSQFEYLLMHELGHFFGLNEEYDSGGPTELEFAPGIGEPWSQNITFLPRPFFEDVKWKHFLDPKVQIPTPDDTPPTDPEVYGVYKGGYAESAPEGKTSYKPGRQCMMDRGPKFCKICQHAIEHVIKRELSLGSWLK